MKQRVLNKGSFKNIDCFVILHQGVNKLCPVLLVFRYEMLGVIRSISHNDRVLEGRFVIELAAIAITLELGIDEACEGRFARTRNAFNEQQLWCHNKYPFARYRYCGLLE